MWHHKIRQGALTVPRRLNRCRVNFRHMGTRNTTLQPPMPQQPQEGWRGKIRREANISCIAGAHRDHAAQQNLQAALETLQASRGLFFLLSKMHMAAAEVCWTLYVPHQCP